MTLRQRKMCNCGHPFTVHTEFASVLRINGPTSNSACKNCGCWKPVNANKESGLCNCDALPYPHAKAEVLFPD